MIKNDLLAACKQTQPVVGHGPRGRLPRRAAGRRPLPGGAGRAPLDQSSGTMVRKLYRGLALADHERRDESPCSAWKRAPTGLPDHPRR